MKIRVLGIESSCDETAVSIVEREGGATTVTAELISSQTDIHEAYGGVVPELAARAHLHNLPLLFSRALEMASLSVRDLNAIAVTRGPGLKGCLLMGTSFAKAVSLGTGIPLLAVNHIEGHLLATVLDNPGLTPPFLALIVSGGHTEIQLVKAPGDYTLVARTGDDAAGEAFDKSAVLLGFPYPGGPLLAREADTVERSRFELPKVMREASGFSFSGLKTAIALLIRREKDKVAEPQVRAELCHAVQASVVDALLFKLRRAIDETGVRSIAVCGGVSANRELRKRVSALPGVHAFFPAFTHCMDNASMIAYAGLERFERGERSGLGFGTLPRWPLEELSAAKGAV